MARQHDSITMKAMKKPFVGPLKVTKSASKTPRKTPEKPEQHPMKPRTRKKLNFGAVSPKERAKKNFQSPLENAKRLSETASKHRKRGVGRYRRKKNSKNMIFERCI